MKSTTPDHPPLNPLPRGEVSVFVLGFLVVGNYVFKKVTTTFLPKKCNNGHKLFPSSDELVVGSYRLACSIKSTAPDYPPLWSLPREEVSVFVLGLLVVGELCFQKG